MLLILDMMIFVYCLFLVVYVKIYCDLKKVIIPVVKKCCPICCPTSSSLVAAVVADDDHDDNFGWISKWTFSLSARTVATLMADFGLAHHLTIHQEVSENLIWGSKHG